MHRALVHEIAILDHLLDVVGGIRADIAAALCQLAHCHLGISNVEQHHALHVVDVVDAEPIELEVYDFEKMPVKLPYERDHLKVTVRHIGLDWLRYGGNLAVVRVKLNRKIEFHPIKTTLDPASGLAHLIDTTAFSRTSHSMRVTSRKVYGGTASRRQPRRGARSS